MKYKNWENPMGVDPVNKLLLRFSVPAIISFLVSALYNIVDQIFIGQGVGMLGNAATNVSFPMNNLALSICLLLGAGGAARYSLSLGERDYDRAAKFAGNVVSYVMIFAVILVVIIRLNLEKLLILFGATENVLPYARTYAGITSLGLPFLMFTVGFSAIIRGDGSPKFAMLSNLVGAIINTILDPIFIFGFNMGIAGGAWATVIGQFASFLVCLYYIWRMKNVRLTRESFIPSLSVLGDMARLGFTPLINQISMMLSQIVLNNTLTYYGAMSKYGEDIPLAVVGVITKVSIIYFAFIIGISQGSQPITGFNYGAKQYDRVKATFKLALKYVMIISVIFFAIFQIFPRQLLSIFGKGSELFYEFGVAYFRIFLFTTVINGIQPLGSFFFTSIGKAKKGTLVSLTRQILFLIPLVYLFSRLFGIEGVLYSGPIADVAACILVTYLVSKEMKEMDLLMEAQG